MQTVLLGLEYVPAIVFGLLPIMNPLSTIPLFLGLTANMTRPDAHRQARRACLYAFFILVAFLLLGNGIIALFGISMPGIRVAGGLIILVLSFRMLFFGESETTALNLQPGEVQAANLDFSFSPLAMPSLAGPGSIAVVMSYGSQIPPEHEVVGHIVVVVGIALTTAISYVALLWSTWFAKFFGRHGLLAITKIMGFLLACIAVQFIASGVREFIVSLA